MTDADTKAQTPNRREGALAGLRVVELAKESIALAGKLLGDMGADVILVEPPGGDPTRNYPPFLDDKPGPDRSLLVALSHQQTRCRRRSRR